MTKDYPHYFKWLYEQTGYSLDPLSKHTPHFNAARQLFDTQFRYFVSNDDNRAMDGICLRDLIHQETNMLVPSEDVPCNVLEMMVALAARADFASENLHIVSGIPAWMQLMLDNLGLGDISDMEYYTEPGVEEYVQIIIDNLVARNYDYDGKGGLFPLMNPAVDQAGIEIWYQLEAYIQERADFSDIVADEE